MFTKIANISAQDESFTLIINKNNLDFFKIKFSSNAVPDSEGLCFYRQNKKKLENVNEHKLSFSS